MTDFGHGWAGGQSQSFALAQGMVERGHDVTFVCLQESEMSRRLAEGPMGCVQIPVGGRLDLVTVFRLLSIMLRMSPQVVHAHDSLSFWLAGLAARLGRLSAPIIAHKRTDHPPGRFAALRYRRLAHHIIAISRAAENVLLQAHIPREKVSLIYSSVDCERFRPDDGNLARGFRAEMGLPPDLALVGTIGALVPRKGQVTLLQAAEAVLRARPETRFLICGSGPLEGLLGEHARRLGIDGRVVFLPEREDVRPLLASLEVFVLPSAAEGLGVSALEAMAMGKPVVASRVGGLVEVVEDGETGFLVEPKEAGELAQALLRLLREGELRERFAKNARERAESLFGRAVMLDRTEELYFSCLS